MTLGGQQSVASCRSLASVKLNNTLDKAKGEHMPETYRDHCCDCPYSRRGCRRLPLNMEENPNSTALLILQSPGKEEWEQRRPLCSSGVTSAAVRIENSLDRIGRCRKEFSITNAVQCFPSGTSSSPDFIKAHGQCANWLRQDIEARDWRRIVVFGRIAELSVRSLGYSERTDRVRFLLHPTRGQVDEADIDDALRWALDL